MLSIEEALKMSELQQRVDYYESLVDYLDDCVPCLSELVERFNEETE